MRKSYSRGSERLYRSPRGDRVLSRTDILIVDITFEPYQNSIFDEPTVERSRRRRQEKATCVSEDQIALSF